VTHVAPAFHHVRLGQADNSAASSHDRGKYQLIAFGLNVDLTVGQSIRAIAGQ